MSLIPCSDCGREISSLAPACVHCGRPATAAAHAATAVVPAPYAALAECPLCAAAVTHANARTGGVVWCERCGGQLIYGTDGALVRALPRGLEAMHQPRVQPVVVVGNRKSVSSAVLLAMFFGPLGMLYSTVGGAFIMFFASIFAMMVTFGLGIFVTWPICVLWAAHAASEHNRRQAFTLAA